jgi:hypothetical protein
VSSPSPADPPSRHLYYAESWKVGPAGASDTRFVNVQGVAKLASPSGPYAVINELVAYRLGAALGVSVPPGMLLHVPAAQMSPPPPPAVAVEGAAWVSLSFQPLLVSLAPLTGTALAKIDPSAAAGVVVFDLLIANTDRHSGNLAVATGPVLPPGQAHVARVEVFDHSHAVVHSGNPSVAEYLTNTRDLFVIDGGAVGGNRQCLLDHIADVGLLRRWTKRARAFVTDGLVDEVCGEASMLGVPAFGAAEASLLAAYLKHRRDHLDDLLVGAKASFPTVPASAWTTSP